MIKFIDGSAEFRGSAIIIGTNLTMTEDVNGVPRLDSSASGYTDPLTTDGDILIRDTTTKRLAKGADNKILKLVAGLPSWETESAGGASDLDALTDVTIGSTANRQVLAHDGGSLFVNRLLVEADISNLQSYLLGITGEPLEDLQDVTLSGIASGELLEWNGSVWRNRTFVELGFVTTLSSLTDVTISGPIGANEILRWTGSAWINRTLVEANILALTGGTMSGDLTMGAGASLRILRDDERVWVGASNDASFYHDGSESYLRNSTGILNIYNVANQNIEFFTNNTLAMTINANHRVDVFNGLRVENGAVLRIANSDESSYGSFSHDGADLNLVVTNTTQYDLSGFTSMLVRGNLRVVDGNALRVNDVSNSNRGEWTHDGTNFLLDCTNTTVYKIAGADLQLDQLGVFDRSVPPTKDQVLSHDGNKWIPRNIATSFSAGDVTAGQVSDGTEVAFVDDGRNLTGAPTPDPTTAPTITSIYKGFIVDMGVYSLGGTEAFVVEYEVSDDTGTWIVVTDRSTADTVVHSGLAIDGSVTFKYRYKVKGSSTVGPSSATSSKTPLNTPNVYAFGVILASQMAVSKLSSLTVNFGSATMDSLVVTTNILNRGDMQTLGSAYFRTVQVDAISSNYGEGIPESVVIAGGEFNFIGLEGEDFVNLFITANTVANPTVCTVGFHAMNTGDRVYIFNSNSTPSINGYHVITDVDSTHFSVPVDVTIAGTAASLWSTVRTTNTLLGNYGTNRGGSAAVENSTSWANNNPSVTTASIDTFVDAGQVPLNDVGTSEVPNDDKLTVKFNLTLDDNITSAINYIDSQARVTVEWRETSSGSWKTHGTANLWSEIMGGAPLSQDFTSVINTSGYVVTGPEVRLTYAGTVHAQKVTTGSITVDGSGSAGEYVQFNFDGSGKSFTRRGMKFYQDILEPYIYMEPIDIPPGGGNTAAGEIWFNGITNNLEWSNGTKAVIAGTPGKLHTLIGGETTLLNIELQSSGMLVSFTGQQLVVFTTAVEGYMTRIVSGSSSGVGSSIRNEQSPYKTINGLVFEGLIRTHSNISSTYFWIGFTSTSQRNNVSTVAAGNFIGVQWDGTFLWVVVRNGSSQTRFKYIGVSPLTINTSYYIRIEIDGTNAVHMTVNDTTTVIASTNLPAVTTGLHMELAVVPSSNSARSLIFSYVNIYLGN